MSQEKPPNEKPVEEAPPIEPQRVGHRHERDEKDEKDRRQDEEKKEEKGRGQDGLSGVIWALILITAGLIFLAQSTLGMFSWERFGGAWNLVFVAVGLILLFEVVVRLLFAAFRRPVAGTLVFAFFLLAIGISGIIGRQITWAIFLIFAGIAILVSGLFRGRF